MSQSFDAQPARDPRLQQVLDRAASDAQFRERLLTSPHAAIRDTFGVNIPAGFRIKFIERGADADALIVLPDVAQRAASATSASGELDDAALESVAGGWDDSSTAPGSGTSTDSPTWLW